MKKSGWVFVIFVLVLISGAVWLLRGADPKHIQRQEIIVDVADAFEK